MAVIGSKNLFMIVSVEPSLGCLDTPSVVSKVETAAMLVPLVIEERGYRTLKSPCLSTIWRG
jgi:hypothetical protein